MKKMIKEYDIGTVVQMKKQHPCGSYECQNHWAVVVSESPVGSFKPALYIFNKTFKINCG